MRAAVFRLTPTAMRSRKKAALISIRKSTMSREFSAEPVRHRRKPSTICTQKRRQTGWCFPNNSRISPRHLLSQSLMRSSLTICRIRHHGISATAVMSVPEIRKTMSGSAVMMLRICAGDMRIRRQTMGRDISIFWLRTRMIQQTT